MAALTSERDTVQVARGATSKHWALAMLRQELRSIRGRW